MRRLALSLLSLSALAAGCERRPAETPSTTPPAAEAAGQYVSQAGFDTAGYYHPLSDVQVGNYRLEHIAVGAPSDFAQWQEGRREGVFGPIIFRFGDVTSPGPVKALGVEGFTTQFSLLPTHYVWSPSKVEFTGTDPSVGEVSFSGAFDLAGLDQARSDPDHTQPALKGVLKVGGQTFADLQFGFSAGD